MAYRFYMSESLRIINENIVDRFGGRSLSTSFIDLIDNKPKDTRTAEEIAEDIINRINNE